MMTVAILVVLCVLLLGLVTVVTVLAFKGLAKSRRDMGPWKPRDYYWLNSRGTEDKPSPDRGRPGPTEQN